MMKRLLSPKLPVDAAGRAKVAPLGLRRIEAALIAAGTCDAADVAVTTPEALDRVIGPETRVVGVSSSDPLGRGMSNTTTAVFCGGELYTRRWTRELLGRIAEAKNRFGFKVLFGGAGAWQLSADDEQRRGLGIDTVFEGYFERQGPALVADMLRGEQPPEIVRESHHCVDAAAGITAPSLMGAVELSRGCGKGCSFCAMGRMKMAHFSPERICRDIERNLAGGVANVVSTSEDFFRYGAQGPRVNPEAIFSLLERIRGLDGLRFLQVDHANISSVLQFDAADLREIRRLMTWDQRCEALWVNLGAESANGDLVARTGPAKILPFAPADWESMILESVVRLEEAGFYPVVSLVLGLPGETPDDVARTRRLVDRLAEHRAVVFPVFHEPIHGDGRFHVGRMRMDQFELFRRCYDLNFDRVPDVFRDNQRAGGVPWAKRKIVRMLGRGEVLLWRRRFRKLQRTLEHRPDAVGAPAGA
jgi:radical SAM superfamily enzyme YgiQ (UPF0313 family)